MFDQLVVSASQRRKHTTAKFFFGTSALYIFMVALAFAVSVLVSDPKLADTGRVLTLVAPLPPATGAPLTSGPQPPTRPSARPDPNNFMSLDKLMTRRNAAPPLIQLVGRLSGDPTWGSSDVPGFGPGIGVVEGNRTVEPAPSPDPPTKPKSPAPTTTIENRPLRVSSTVLQGKAIERRTPPYPELARQIRLPGEVSIEVIISPEGRVESVRVVSGHPLLVSAARDAARGWRFEPTFLNGVPVRVTGVITFVFKLSE